MSDNISFATYFINYVAKDSNILQQKQIISQNVASILVGILSNCPLRFSIYLINCKPVIDIQMPRFKFLFKRQQIDRVSLKYTIENLVKLSEMISRVYFAWNSIIFW